MLERFHVPEKDRVYVQQERVHAATEAILRHSGVSARGAKDSAEVLITNDLRGVESHGVSNGLRRYVRQYASKELNPRPKPKILKETSTTARVDGDFALGTEVGIWCMNMAIEKARAHGVGAVSLKNTGHLAGCGYYAYMATEHDMLGHMMTAGGGHQTVPTFGAKPLFGTNPVAWAAPAGKMPPYLLDVATTQVAGNKIELARRVGATLYPGWIAKKDGTPIMEEVPAPPAGTYYMLPFGGTRERLAQGVRHRSDERDLVQRAVGYGPRPPARPRRRQLLCGLLDRGLHRPQRVQKEHGPDARGVRKLSARSGVRTGALPGPV